MKLALVLLMSAVGCQQVVPPNSLFTAKPDPARTLWEQRFAQAREDLYAENVYIKAHHGKDAGFHVGDEITVLNSTYPEGDDHRELSSRLMDLTLCEFTISSSIYWWGSLHIGPDPTPEIESCHQKGRGRP